MTAINETIAGVAAPTIANPQKPAKVFNIIVPEVGQGGQCDCDHGLRWVFGIAQPCHKCRDGQWMFQCQQASDYLEIYG